jgi:hypothetical protein
MDLANVETVVFTGGGGGEDRFAIGDLAGTAVRRVDIHLGLPGGDGDGQADVVEVAAAAGGRTVLTGAAGGAAVGGLAEDLRLDGADALDRLSIVGGSGGETLDATALAEGMVVNFNGGDGADVLAFASGSAADVIVMGGGGVAAEGEPVLIQSQGAVSQINLANVETVAINTGDGDDQVNASSYGAMPALVVDAGEGADTVLGGRGGDSLAGGKGNDLIEGGFGGDTIDAGVGDDTVVWNPGGGSDTVDGGKGLDAFVFDASNASETISILDFGGHATVTRDVAGVVVDLDNVERVAFAGAGGGTDHFYFSLLGGTDVQRIDVDLGAPDGVEDTVVLSGEAVADRILITGGPGAVTVSGLPVELHVANGEAMDRLGVAAFDGDDVIDATAVQGGGVGLRFNGGGADTFVFGHTAGVDAQIVDFYAHGLYAEADRIVLNGFADHSFADALANQHIVQSGEDVVISDGAGPVITLLRTSLSILHADDFVFG